MNKELRAELVGRQSPQASLKHEDMILVRNEVPFLPVKSIPTWSKTVLLAADSAVNVDLPDSAVLMEITADNDIWIDVRGQAVRPAIAGTVNDSGAILNPSGLYYVQDVRSVSILSQYANTAVSVACWSIVL